MKVVNGGTTGNEIFRDVIHNGENYRITMIQLSHKYRTWLLAISNSHGDIVFRTRETHTNFNKLMKIAEQEIS